MLPSDRARDRPQTVTRGPCRWRRSLWLPTDASPVAASRVQPSSSRVVSHGTADRPKRVDTLMPSATLSFSYRWPQKVLFADRSGKAQSYRWQTLRSAAQPSPENRRSMNRPNRAFDTSGEREKRPEPKRPGGGWWDTSMRLGRGERQDRTRRRAFPTLASRSRPTPRVVCRGARESSELSASRLRRGGRSRARC